jgi:hypothetical protein
MTVMGGEFQHSVMTTAKIVEAYVHRKIFAMIEAELLPKIRALAEQCAREAMDSIAVEVIRDPVGAPEHFEIRVRTKVQP